MKYLCSYNMNVSLTIENVLQTQSPLFSIKTICVQRYKFHKRDKFPRFNVGKRYFAIKSHFPFALREKVLSYHRIRTIYSIKSSIIMFHFRRFKKQESEGNFGRLFVARLSQEFKNINMRDFGYNFIVEIRRVTFYTMADYRSK